MTFAVFDISSHDGLPVIVALYRDEAPALARTAQLEWDRQHDAGVRFPLIPRFYRQATDDEVKASVAAGLPIIQ